MVAAKVSHAEACWSYFLNSSFSLQQDVELTKSFIGFSLILLLLAPWKNQSTCELRQECQWENWISFKKQRNTKVSSKTRKKRNIKTSHAHHSTEVWLYPPRFALQPATFGYLPGLQLCKSLPLHCLLPHMLWLSLEQPLSLSDWCSSLLSSSTHHPQHCAAPPSQGLSHTPEGTLLRTNV